jgi:hypothetical protein
MGNLIDNINEIKVIAQRIHDNIDSTDYKVLKLELWRILSINIHVIAQLESENNRLMISEHAKRIFASIKELLKNSLLRRKSISDLMEKIIILENHDLISEIRIQRFEKNTRSMLLSLLDRSILSQEEINDFLKSIKGKINNRDFKKIKKTLNKKLEVIYESPGPKYKSQDINNLRSRIDDFFSSPFGDKFPDGERILFYLFGSLVTGYCNNPRKSHYGRPSDEGRISDVDLMVVISPDFFNKLFTIPRPELIATFQGTTRTKPIGLDTSGLKATGPFISLFDVLSHLRFAGKNNRPIHAVFTDMISFKAKNYEDEPNILVHRIPL